MCENPLTKRYTFTTSKFDGGEIESDRLVINDGIVVRFNRYSLCQVELEQVYQNFELNPKFPTRVGIYEYCRKNIIEGYIYMYSATLKNIIEYRCIAGILIQGTTHVWDEETLDVREIMPSNDYKDYIIVSENRKYWFAYSTEQWSVSYIQSMINDQALREERFQKFYPKELKNNPDAVLCNKIKIFHDKEDTDKYEKVAYDKYIQGLGEIMKLDNKEPYIYFSLHDPIGCATDLRKDQLVALGQLNELVSSIATKTTNDSRYTGEDYNYLHLHALTFYKMFYGNSSGSSETDGIISSLRSYVAEQKFLEKILLVQEREEARVYANNIRRTMLTFVNSEYYRSVLDDFTKNHPHHMECGIERVVEHHKGISMDANLIDRHIDVTNTEDTSFNEEVTTYMQEAAQLGHKIDQLLSKGYDIEDIIYIEKDKPFDIKKITAISDLIWSNMTNAGIAWKDHLEDLAKEANTNTATPPATPTPTPSPAPSTTTTAAGKAAKEGVELVETAKGHFLVVNERWFNKVEIKERTIKGPRGGVKKINCWVFDKMTMDELLKEMHCINKESYIKRGGRGPTGKVATRVRRIADTTGKIIGGYRKNIVIEVLIDEAARAASQQTPVPPVTPSSTPPASPPPPAGTNNTLKILQGIFNSKAFMGLTSFMSACNLAATVSNANFDKAPIHGLVSITAAITELGQFTTNFIALYSKIPEHLYKRFMNLSQGLGVVATTALGIVNVIDGIDALNKNNTKAGLAYIGSALGFFAAAGITAAQLLSAAPPWWARNKYLIIAYIVGVGLMLLAIYLTHTPMEEFLANCILQKDAVKKVDGWKSMKGHEIMQKLCENKEDIIGSNFPDWHSLRKSLECFMLLMMNMNVKPKHEVNKHEDASWWKKIVYSYTTEYELKSISVECFYNNLTFDSHVEYSLRVFYTKPNDEDNLYCKDISGYFTETDNGCKIEYSRWLIDINLLSSHKARVAYFFQRVIYDNGSCFPPINDKGEDIYFMERVDIDSVYSNVGNGGGYIYKAAKDIMELNGNENRAPLSIDKLHEIVINNNSFGKSRRGKKRQVVEEKNIPIYSIETGYA